jgi:integrase
MPHVALKLTPTANGGFSARKRIPADVQEAYEKLYGVRWEERWNSKGSVPAGLANAKAREWLSDIEGRISSIRSERRGEGQTLTPMRARALAGEWYHWFTARNLKSPQPLEHWRLFHELLSDRVREGVLSVRAAPDDLNAPPNTYELWEENFAARADARSFAADWAETSQFLHSKRISLDHHSRELFLDYVCRDLFAALDLLIRRDRGDYGPDTHPEEFPRFERTGDPGLSPWALFEQWIAETKPAGSTVDRWRAVFLKLTNDFPSATALTPEEARSWAKGLITVKRSAGTVRDIWVSAAKTIFSWAADQHLISASPFERVKIPVPRKTSTRDRVFEPGEMKTILAAALAISDVRSKTRAARRWVPWLCAYTGARVGEITQLRGTDVLSQEGIHAIKITPDAGTVKTRKSRTVPLHEHLIEQGFLAFVKACGKGPLFYKEIAVRPAPDATNPPKPRYAKAREHLADWVRKLGITDKGIHPNHAWRHTFMQIARRHGMTIENLYAITGHSPRDIGGAYGVPTLTDKAEALKKFPRYETSEPTNGA